MAKRHGAMVLQPRFRRGPRHYFMQLCCLYLIGWHLLYWAPGHENLSDDPSYVVVTQPCLHCLQELPTSGRSLYNVRAQPPRFRRGTFSPLRTQSIFACGLREEISRTLHGARDRELKTMAPDQCSFTAVVDQTDYCIPWSPTP